MSIVYGLTPDRLMDLWQLQIECYGDSARIFERWSRLKSSRLFLLIVFYRARDKISVTAQLLAGQLYNVYMAHGVYGKVLDLNNPPNDLEPWYSNTYQYYLS